jgi:AraC family transcriptional regulator
MDNAPVNASGVSDRVIDIAPAGILRRQRTHWNGIGADVVEFTERKPFSYQFQAHSHMLIVSERQARDDGETLLEGLPKSTLREFSHKLSFVPAGHYFSGWQRPRVLGRVTYLYFDPKSRLLDSELRLPEKTLKPRLFFFDQGIWESAVKLKSQSGKENSSAYAEALALVTMHELLRLERESEPSTKIRGGLAAWQKKQLTEYVEEHLDEDISLNNLAALARLSPFHLAHAFKQSFGEPPHRYITGRRMLRAEGLLATPMSVTEIGRKVGFVETSSFTAAFRRSTGMTPTGYRRHLDHSV